MANYFRHLPDFEYANNQKNSKISDYDRVKNLFKRGYIREDIFNNITFFEKYRIVGDERPDNIAFKFYGDSTLDWIILLSNNITNLQTEWPIPQSQFDEYLLEKYGGYNTLYNGIHHYETKEVKNSQGVIIYPGNLIVNNPFKVSYYDFFTDSQIDIANIAVPITNYEYEEKIETEKRSIFLLKNNYVNIIIDDMEEIMKYEKGATQYVSDTLVRGDNIKIYN